MRKYFPESKSSGRSVQVELDLSNYATKVDLKNTTGVDTSKVAKKFDPGCLKFNVHKLDIDKLKSVTTNWSNLKSKVDKPHVNKLVAVPVDLIKVSNVVKNDVVERDVYNVKIKTIEDKKPDINKFTTNTSLNAKMNEV